MITGSLIALSLLLGYTVAVLLLLAATFWIAAAVPRFVSENYRVRNRYKLLQDLLWLVCVTAGSYVTAWVAGTTHPWLVRFSLVAILVSVPWMNSWETRQRGMAHQLLMNLVSVVGVLIGYSLRMR